MAYSTSSSLSLDTHIVIVGACGFLGRGIVRAIKQKHTSWTITAMDRDLLPSTITSNIAEFYQLDITDQAKVKAAFKDMKTPPDIVLHCAAMVPARALRYSIAASDWQQVKAVNVGGTLNVLSAAQAIGCQRCVYTSSIAAIIDDLEHNYPNMAEDSTPTGLAQLNYGKSKCLAEDVVLSQIGMQVCILRPCPILGPEDIEVMSVLHDLIARGETSFIIGDGDNLADWMYVDNAVDAHLLAVENLLTTSTAAGQVFFVTNHEPVYFWDVLAYIWAQFGHKAPMKVHIPVFLALWVGYLVEIIVWLTGIPMTFSVGTIKDGMKTYYANNEKAINILGYRPKISLSEGIRRSCEGYKQHLKLLAEIQRSNAGT